MSSRDRIGRTKKKLKFKIEKVKVMKEEIKKRIYNWTLALIRALDLIDKTNSSNVIGKQLLRSGTSVGANYIEAQAASSKKDFINFLHHSLKSANESRYWLDLLKDTKKISQENIGPLIKELEEIANILGASIR